LRRRASSVLRWLRRRAGAVSKPRPRPARASPGLVTVAERPPRPTPGRRRSSLSRPRPCTSRPPRPTPGPRRSSLSRPRHRRSRGCRRVS